MVTTLPKSTTPHPLITFKKLKILQRLTTYISRDDDKGSQQISNLWYNISIQTNGCARNPDGQRTLQSTCLCLCCLSNPSSNPNSPQISPKGFRKLCDYIEELCSRVSCASISFVIHQVTLIPLKSRLKSFLSRSESCAIMSKNSPGSRASSVSASFVIHQVTLILLNLCEVVEKTLSLSLSLSLSHTHTHTHTI
jgi:hypothetical protein